ncbi:hypothetical protein RAD15_31210 [Bradyrhizobium sp. 14AA]
MPITEVEVSLPDDAGGVLFVVARAGLVALGRGSDASGGASETGGATEVWPVALSCDHAQTNMRLRARRATLLIRILSAASVPRLMAWSAEPRRDAEYQDSHGRQSIVARMARGVIRATIPCVA